MNYVTGTHTTNSRFQTHSHSDKLISIAKLRFGPTSPLFLSNSPHHKNTKLPLRLPLSPSPQQTPQNIFIEELTSRYKTERLTHADIATNFSRNDELSIYWKTLSVTGSLPDARSGGKLLQFDANIYLYGGEKSDTSLTLHKLNYSNLVWEKFIFSISEFPRAISGQIAVPYKDQIIVYGGYEYKDSNLSIRVLSSLVYSYSIQTGEWTSYLAQGKSQIPRRNHAAAIVGRTLLIYSGIDAAGEVIPGLEVLDLKSKKWSTHKIIGDLPEPRTCCTLTPVYSLYMRNSKGFNIFSCVGHQDALLNYVSSGVYLFGGIGAHGKALNDLYLLKGVTDKKNPRIGKLVWSKILAQGNLPIPRYNHSANLVGNYLVIIGGRNDKFSGGICPEIALMKVTTWKWERLRVFGIPPQPRFGSATCSIGSKILLFGGMNLYGFASNEVYELEIDQKKVIEMRNSEV